MASKPKKLSRAQMGLSMARGRITKFQKNGQVSAMDHKFTGEEPTWEDANELNDAEFDIKLIRTFSFYNYYLDSGDLASLVKDFMKRHGFTDHQAAQAKSLCRFAEIFAISRILRCATRGLKLSHSRIPTPAKMKLDIYRALGQINYAPPVADDNSVSPIVAKHRPNPQALMEAAVNEKIIGPLDKMMDLWITSGDEKIPRIKLLDSLKNAQVPGPALRHIVAWIRKHHDEMLMAFRKDDAQLEEGYSYLSKKGLKQRLLVLQHMLKEIEQYKAEKKATQKKRVPKTKTLDQQVKHLKFQPTSKEYKLTSVPPTRVPGAMHLYAFNTKYRTLTVFHAKGHDGMTIKGTTMKDFDEETSYTIGLRKPNDILKKVIAKTPAQIEKIVSLLSGKKRPVMARINENTIILRSLDKTYAI